MKPRSLYRRGKTPGLKFPEPSKAKQSFLKDADINNIMRKYINTGVLVADDGTPRRSPLWGDFATGADYQTICNNLIQLKADFLNLKSETRELFNNNPSELLDFMADPSNAAECVELGLLPPVTSGLTSESVGGQGGSQTPQTTQTDSKESQPQAPE